MGNYIAYVRVSTENQSIENQQLRIYEYAREHGFEISQFISVSISSRKSKKKRKLDELFLLLSSGDTLVCTELSRLGRSMSEILSMIDELTERKIKLIFTNQPELSTFENNAYTKLLYSVYAYFVQTERDIMSDRTKQGLERARANGKTLGRPKGSVGFSKLDGKEKIIAEYLDLKLNKTSISQLLKVSRPCLISFMNSREDKILKFRKQKE